MAHQLVDQLRFARSELVRSLAGISDEDARRRLEPMNCISWIVGHLADKEQRFFLQRQGVALAVPGLNEVFGHDKPASTPPLDEMWSAWEVVTRATDPILDVFTGGDLLAFPVSGGSPSRESHGTMLLRTVAHYWFHNGEAQAVRQLIGHRSLPQFVGDIGREAPYRPS